MHISGWACLLFLHPSQQANFPRGQKKAKASSWTLCVCLPWLPWGSKGSCIFTSRRPESETFLPCGQGIQAHPTKRSLRSLRVNLGFQPSPFAREAAAVPHPWTLLAPRQEKVRKKMTMIQIPKGERAPADLVTAVSASDRVTGVLTGWSCKLKVTRCIPITEAQPGGRRMEQMRTKGSRRRGRELNW